MTGLEIIALRDDALLVIASIFQGKPETRMPLAEQTLILQRAVAMHEAACLQLKNAGYAKTAGKLQPYTPEEEEYLLGVEEKAIAVVKAWSSTAIMDAEFVENFSRKIADLAQLFPQEGGAS